MALLLMDAAVESTILMQAFFLPTFTCLVSGIARSL